jgi:hypothetical protein
VVSGAGSVQAGGGDDTIVLKGGVFATTIDGGTGRNELDAAGSKGGALMSFSYNADGRSGTVQGMNGASATIGTVWSPATDATTFKNIDILDTSGNLTSVVNWNTANHITINGNSGKQDFFFINGGGNHIDGRYVGSGETASSISNSFAILNYNKMTSGLNADFDSGRVSFADGRDQDTIANFSRFRGTASNDVIKGHVNQSDWIIASGGNDSIDAGGGTANTYAIDNDTINVHADFDTGVVLKYDGTGKLVGTDTVRNFQQYYGGSQSDWVHGKDGVDMVLNFGAGGNNSYVGNKANNSIDGGSGNTHLYYDGMAAPITVDLANGKVVKGDNGGTDTFKSVFEVVGTKGDDIFTFNSQADVTKAYLNGAGGNDVLQKSGTTANTYDLSSMLAKVSNITKIDFSASAAADKITVDFTNLLSRGNETLTLTTGSKDTITMTHNTALDGWTHTTSVTDGHTTDTYALGGHQLIWNH